MIADSSPAFASGGQPDFEITAVQYGKLETSRSDIFLNYHDYGQEDAPADLFYYFWIVRNAEHTIVLDTGFRADVGERRGRVVLSDPQEALRALEVADDPDTLVVISHGHYDHIGNLDYFAHANFVMSEAEYRFWADDPRQQHLTQRLVESDEIEVLRRLRADGRLKLIAGDLEICPGVTLVNGPGHTPGQLMMLVSTGSGRVLLAADAVHTDEELERDMPFRHMCDIVESVGTYQAIREMVSEHQVDRVFPGHEVADFHKYPPDERLADHARLISVFY